MNNAVIGILNINNMIPVRDEYIYPFSLDYHPDDSIERTLYKQLCTEELIWCNNHETEITMLANELHHIICNNLPFGKRSICPNYAVLEAECKKERPISKRNQKKRCNFSLE